jgi:3-oxoacyl-[acyl-carrier protein] reductase
VEGRLTHLSRSIAGKRAVVTGAASGMGRATAHLFADEGARVAVVDLGEDRVAEVVEEIRSVHGPDAAQGWVADVSDGERIHRLVAEVVGAFGGLDILVNNAGISLPAGAASDDAEFDEVWAATLAVNLTAQARMVRAALPHLQAAGGGRVVNIASTEGLIATAGITAYTASKHGVIGLTKSLAVELGRTGVTVNCVCPGPITTAMTAAIPEEVKEVYARRRVPLRRYGDPEEVAHMTLSLVLPAASFVNGAVVVVDGGMTIRH